MHTSPSERPVHRLLLSPRAQKDLDRLVGDTWQRVREALTSLSYTPPRPKGCAKLSTGAWRVKIGRYQGTLRHR
jgi:mRNA-degrading endonuclease RelE of RelBE toxin-antitoxin system